MQNTYGAIGTPINHYNDLLLQDLHVTELERKAAIDYLASDTFKYHYQTPQHILRYHDYQVSTLAGDTDWYHGTLRNEQGMVCSYTGYTRNQMLAAMLNTELADEIELAYSERVDAQAEAALAILDYVQCPIHHSALDYSNAPFGWSHAG